MRLQAEIALRRAGRGGLLSPGHLQAVVGLALGASRLRSAITATVSQARQTSSDMRMQPLQAPFRVCPRPSTPPPARPLRLPLFQRDSAGGSVSFPVDRQKKNLLLLYSWASLPSPFGGSAPVWQEVCPSPHF